MMSPAILLGATLYTIENPTTPLVHGEIEVGRSVPDDWDAALFEPWAVGRAARDADRAARRTIRRRA